jgi:hypothetical protein
MKLKATQQLHLTLPADVPLPKYSLGQRIVTWEDGQTGVIIGLQYLPDDYPSDFSSWLKGWYYPTLVVYPNQAVDILVMYEPYVELVS